MGASTELATTAYFIGNLSKTIQKDIVKNLETEINEKDVNILEFYNSAIESRISTELLEKISPKFIFSTKEKGTTLISDGEGWEKIK